MLTRSYNVQAVLELTRRARGSSARQGEEEVHETHAHHRYSLRRARRASGS